MKFTQIIKIAFTNLKSNKMRSFLTIFGIAIGISSIVFLVSLGYGLQDLSINKIASIEAINTLDITPGKNSAQKIDKELIEKLEADTDFEKISPLLSYGVKVVYEGNNSDIVGNFVNDDYSALEGVDPVFGSFFSNTENEIVVSTAFLKALDIESTDAVGKEIASTVLVIDSDSKEKKEVLKTYKVLGVIQDDSTTYAYIPVASISSEVSDNVVYNSLKAKAALQEKIPEIKEKITSMGYSVTSIADTIDQVDRVFRVVQIILAFFGMVALLVASIGMFNTMTIALLERTRDIGVMKAIGVRNKDVSRIFLTEAMVIAFSGGIIGVALGYATSKVINIIVNMLAKSVGGEAEKLFSMPILFSAGILIFSTLVGIATGFYPSKRASKLNPLDALRYE